jgi:hypothetical protein
MMRAIVLVFCLASAGGIAAYTLYSRGDSGAPVYTVPSRSFDLTPQAAQPRRVEPDDRVALTRELQRELKRVGCYRGETTGVWSTSSRLAMKTFVERVNAALPIDNPDPVLLSLVQSHRGPACGVACPAGQTETASGACVPTAVLATTAKEPSPATKSDTDASDAGKTGAAATDGGRQATASQTGPAPPEGVRRPHRRAQGPRPPKLVRDFLKALGIK